MEFLVGRGKAVGRCGQAESLGGEAPYALAVHGEAGGVGRHMVAFGLELDEHRGGDGPLFQVYMVGLLEGL